MSLRIAFTAAVLLAAAVHANATVLVPVEFGEMVAQSQLIVRGRVTGVQSQTTADRRKVQSLVTVTVLDALKGTPAGTVVFRTPGGQVGRYRRVVVGAPEFSPGDEVVLFLKGRAPSLPMPFGLSQGVYRVTHTSDGRALVGPHVGDTPGRVVKGDPARRPVDVDAFARQVRALVGRQP